MIDIIKGLWKWIVWILVLLILGCVILAFRIFVIDKDYEKKDKNLATTDTVNGGKNSYTSSAKNGVNLDKIGHSVVNGVKTIGNATVQGYKGDEDYDYNAYNFDEAFLMYEGEQYDGAVKSVLEHLIENSNGNFYARTSVTAVNFGNNVTINYNGDVSEYQNAIKSLQDSVTSGNYDISFKYGGFGTYVNEIVITKK